MNEWDLIWRLGLALVLSASIGLDRELRQKSAGLFADLGELDGVHAVTAGDVDEIFET